MRVKICGLTRPEDALAAEAAGADAVALNFAPGSKRQVTLEQAAQIIAPLGPLITRVGVFVDAPLEMVLEAVRALRLSAVQLHGSEDAGYAAALRSQVTLIKAVRFQPGIGPDAFATFPADALLLDAPTPGGGEAFAWNEAAAWRAHPRLILAGGLNADTVGAGIRALEPYAVDVASGVESRAGIKDHEKLQDFVRAAKMASRR